MEYFLPMGGVVAAVNGADLSAIHTLGIFGLVSITLIALLNVLGAGARVQGLEAKLKERKRKR